MLALWLSCGSASAGIGYLVRLELASDVAVTDFAAYGRAVVVPFAEQASRHASWHDRKERREAARKAAQTFPRRLMLALRTTQVFHEVKDVPRPGEAALLVTGVLRRHERGSADARMHFGSGKAGAVFEATLQLSDGATGRVLGLLRIEREPSASGYNAATPRSVEQLMEAAAADCANQIAGLVAA
ncbi:MAG: hypothetical protein ACKVYV_19135 [Limisphaerales bacterium]